MSSSKKPVYVLVGGVSHTPVFFEPLIQELAALGYESEAVAFPTCGTDTTELQAQDRVQWDEVDEIQRVVKSHLDGDGEDVDGKDVKGKDVDGEEVKGSEGRDVVLVAHSYGGIPGSRAVKGLDKEARIRDGKTTGIVEVVFIAAFLLPDDAEREKYGDLPTWLSVENGCRRPNSTAIPLLFSDLPPSEGKRWLAEFAWHRNDTVTRTLPDAPWKLSVPKTYVITMEDRAATLAFQLKMLAGVVDETWEVKSIRSGHEPFVSEPGKLARLLVQSTM